MGIYHRIVRCILNYLSVYIEYITFYLIFPGGTLFEVVQYLYCLSFNWFVRQKNPRQCKKYTWSLLTDTPDWENSKVIGRNRRRIHASSACGYDSSDVREQMINDTQYTSGSCIMLLTGEAGEPNEGELWDFLLVGSPEECPKGWSAEGYSCLSEGDKWSGVALPNHWQLQGFDVPLYTNTVYPFQFDPPRARRNGLWVDTACDLGLNSVTSTSFPAPLHPKEPGENATGLYRRKFSLSSLFERIPGSEGSAIDGNTTSTGHPTQTSKLTAEEEFAKSKFFLVFAGVDSCLSVWVNGQYVGYSQDSCLPAEFDITDICRSKVSTTSLSAEHTLAVKVSRWCDGSYLEDQDKWWLSGIYREVYIEKRPVSFIADFEFTSIVRMREIIPCPEESGYMTPGRSVLSADVIVSVLTEGVRTTSKGMITPRASRAPNAVRVELWHRPTDRKPIAVYCKEVSAGSELPNRVAADSLHRSHKGAVDVVVPADSPGIATVKGTLTEPLVWTTETPFLYTLVVSLHPHLPDAQTGSRPLHARASRVGIRKVSIGGPDNMLRINDAPVTIAGINRHEFNATTGRAVTRASMRADAILLKKLNFNAVRSAHYPQHPYWLQVCDEVGLYVIDEANIETHGFQVLGQPVGYLSNLPEWEAALTARVTRMLERDKNHPCVIGWSLGNESGYGSAHDRMAQWVRLRDPLRFVQYESGGARTAATDIVCPMYMRPHWCEEQARSDPHHRPVILCEYAHAMGNSGGSLAAYWQLFRDPNFPRAQGGFIWDFVDQGLVLPPSVTAIGKVGYAYGGDFGELPNTKQFCCNGIAGPDRALFPGAYEAAHLQSPVEVTLLFDHSRDPVLIVTNRASFGDLSHLCIIVRPCYHSGMVNQHTGGDAFELECGQVAAGSFRKIELVEQLRHSLHLGSVKIDSEAHIGRTVLHFGPAEAWLDLAVMTRPGGCSWHPEPFEVMHTAFTNYDIRKVFERLVRGAPAMPIAGITRGISTSTTTSSSCDSSATGSPFPELTNGNAEGLPFMTVQVINDTAQTVRDVVVRWGDGSVATIGRACGQLTSWQDGYGRELLCSAVEPCFYRAGTDNDRGGALLSYYARWREVGLDRLVCRPQKNAVVSQRRLGSSNTPRHSSSTATSNTEETTAAVELVTAWVLESPRDAVIKISLRCEAKYTFSPFGTIDLDFTAEASANTPPLARCGLRWAMPQEFSSVKYFGLGPHEAYPDRLASVYLGVFESPVQAMHTPYTFPQECGRRADPRWILFQRESCGQDLSRAGGLAVVPIVDERAQGLDLLRRLRAVSDGHAPLLDALSSDNSSGHSAAAQALGGVHGWGFSVSVYSLEMLDATAHNHELVSDNRVHVHIDRLTMGLGGYDSWSSNVDEDFLVQPQLPPLSLRQTTMPAYITPKALRNKTRRALHTAIRLIPWN